MTLATPKKQPLEHYSVYDGLKAGNCLGTKVNQQQSTLYNLLRTSTRKRLARKKWRLGKKFQYKPNVNLLRRLSKTLKISREEALDQLNDLREYLLKYPQYY
jgi:hypothetical protein